MNSVVTTTASTRSGPQSDGDGSARMATSDGDDRADVRGSPVDAATGDLDAHDAEHGHRQQVRPDEVGDACVLGAEDVDQERAGQHGTDDGDADADRRRHRDRRRRGVRAATDGCRHQHERDRRRGEERRAAERGQHAELRGGVRVERAVGDEEVGRLEHGERHERHADATARQPPTPAVREGRGRRRSRAASPAPAGAHDQRGVPGEHGADGGADRPERRAPARRRRARRTAGSVDQAAGHPAVLLAAVRRAPRCRPSSPAPGAATPSATTSPTGRPTARPDRPAGDDERRPPTAAPDGGDPRCRGRPAGRARARRPR